MPGLPKMEMLDGSLGEGSVGSEEFWVERWPSRVGHSSVEEASWQASLEGVLTVGEGLVSPEPSAHSSHHA